MSAWTLGIIGGSGLYDIEELERPRWRRIDSPWGEASDEVLTGAIGDTAIVFLPRHGRGHRLAPTEVNSRANVDVLKRAGCTDVLSISAVGSLRDDLPPGSFAIVRQYIDRTVARPSSFFGDGVVAHVSMADPVCGDLSDLTLDTARVAGLTVTDNATYLAMEGPQFSTRAESRLFRSWGCDVIGMTAMPEARLAREAELPYANLCMVTDYDCWRDETAAVDVASVLAVMKRNAEAARRLVVALAKSLPEGRAPSPIDTCLDQAIVSDRSHWQAEKVRKLASICPRLFG